MNCKQGDLAWITRDPWQFDFVTVLHWAEGEHTLPDGYPGYAGGGGWVCEKACGEFKAPTYRWHRTTRFAVIRDEFLRPIRPSEGDDETLTWAGKPADQREPA